MGWKDHTWHGRYICRQRLREFMTPNKATAGKPISEVDSNTLERYQRGKLQVGQPDSYDRHLVLDHTVSLEHASHRERFEAVAKVASRLADAALAAYRADIRTRQREAGLLPIDGVSHRPHP